jgi:hypothetical protein
MDLSGTLCRPGRCGSVLGGGTIWTPIFVSFALIHTSTGVVKWQRSC